MVRVLYSRTAGASELNAVKIVEFLGVNAQLLPIEHAEPGAGDCWIASATTLASGVAPKVGRGFIYGFDVGNSTVLRELTGGAMNSLEPMAHGRRRYRVEQNARNICRQLSGVSFECDGNQDEFAFIASPSANCSVLIRANGKPTVVALDGARIVLSGYAVSDLDTAVAWPRSTLDFLTGLAPLIMFLRAALGHEVWHNDKPLACFMVDDPLLHPRYGFLDYQDLLETMEQERFCTSLAFIPWNFRRSDSEVVRLFASHPQRYSMCVHGCDHTQGEYGVCDYDVLLGKSRLALRRMDEHQRLYGIGYDDVMVFPQGIFSTTAIGAAKDSGYLAAVNSTPYTTDASSLKLRDLLEPAVTRFSNFPLFVRRKPENLAEIAFDLFLGKPAIFVEHHGYFRNGYGPVRELVRQVNAMDERLQWTSVGEIAMRACLERQTADGDVHVKYFTGRLLCENDLASEQNYLLLRRLSEKERNLRVTVNGKPIETVENAGCLRVALSLKPGAKAEVRIEQSGQEMRSAALNRRGVLYDAKVFVRRRLCEFRDNYVDRSKVLSRYASRAHRLLFKKKSEWEPRD